MVREILIGSFIVGCGIFIAGGALASSDEPEEPEPPKEKPKKAKVRRETTSGKK